MSELWVNFSLAFAISLVLVPTCRFAAIRFGYTAKPREDRWHRRATALLGGIAIVITTVGFAAFRVEWYGLWPLIVGGTAIFLAGLTDDLVSLRPYTKLVIEIAVASFLVFFGYRLAWTDSLTLDTLLTLAWIIGLTNAFNLLDNMDGLSAGVSLIAGFAVLATYALGTEVTPEAKYLALLLGATAGFLVYNFHPASIFMGDSGSLFIGVNLAVLTLGSTDERQGPSSVLSIVAGPVLMLLVPIFDAALVTVSRILSGRNAARGGRDHSSHRLVAIGLSERSAVAVLWTLAALGGLLAVAIRGLNNAWPSMIAALFVLAMIVFAVYLAHVRVYQDLDEASLRRRHLTPFVVNLLYKRRIAEVMLDVCLICIAYYVAYRLRFEGVELSEYFGGFLDSLPIVLGVQVVALFMVGAYRGVWRHFGLMDAVTLGRGVLVGTFTGVCIILYTYRFEHYSRGVFVIYAAFLMLMLTASRASFRLISEFARRRQHAGQRLIIYGAGDGGVLVLRELLGGAGRCYRMLGFVDDDPGKGRSRVQGYPVLGDYQALMTLVAAGVVDCVVISTRLIDVANLERLKNLCAKHRVTLARLHFELDQLVAVS